MPRKVRQRPVRILQFHWEPQTTLWDMCWNSPGVDNDRGLSGGGDESGRDRELTAAEMRASYTEGWWHLEECARSRMVGSPSRQKEHLCSKPPSEKAHGRPVRRRVRQCHLNRGQGKKEGKRKVRKEEE